MKIVLAVCLVLLISFAPALSLADSGNSDSLTIARYVNEISQATD